jgi:hypothetical protein
MNENQDAWGSAVAAEAEAQRAVDRATPAARLAIAELEMPWTLYGVLPLESPFAPYRVCLQRFNGAERKIVAYPAAQDETEARRMAYEQCSAEAAAYQAEYDRVLWRCGVQPAFNALQAARATVERLKQQAIPEARSLGRMKGPPPAPANWHQVQARAPSEAAVMAGKAARSLGAAPEEKGPRIVRVGEKPADPNV